MSNALSNLDQNRWYHIHNAGNAVHYLIGTYVIFENSTTGAVFNQDILPSSAEQIWQFFPVSNGAYILRTLAGGPSAYLSTTYAPAETWIGQTVPRLVSSSAVPDGDRDPERSSIYWSAEFFEDGFVGLWNRANGSEWRLRSKPDAFAVMDRDRTGPPGQRFHLTPAGVIDDVRFSSVVLPTVGGEEMATGAPGAGSDSSGGLSTGAQAVIGAGVGVAVLFAIILGVWFLLRRRKQKKLGEHMLMPQHDEYAQEGVVGYKKIAHLQEVSAESQYAELQGGTNQIVSELPGSMEDSRSRNENPVELTGVDHKSR